MATQERERFENVYTALQYLVTMLDRFRKYSTYFEAIKVIKVLSLVDVLYLIYQK